MYHLMNRNYGCLFVTCIAVGFYSTMATMSVASEKEAVSSAETATGASEQGPAELSVPPLDHVEYPDDRPSWLSDFPDLESTDHTWVVVTPSCDSVDAADESVHELAKAAVGFYIEQLTGLSVETIDFPLDDAWVENELIAKEYAGELSEGNSARYESAVMLEFTPEVQAEIREAAKNFAVRQRLGAVGLIVTGLFGMFMLGSGLLSVVTRHVPKRTAPEPASIV